MKMLSTPESSKNNSGSYVHLITTTDPKYLDKYATIMVMYFGFGMSQRKIAKELGMSKSGVVRVLEKYYPKESDRDLVITISSKV